MQQTIANGSFETNNYNACVHDRSNSDYTSNISSIAAFGTSNKNDILWGSSGGACSFAPQSGNYFGCVEYWDNFIGTTGYTAISFPITGGTLTAGTQYTLTFYDRNILYNGNHVIGDLEVGYSSSPSSFGTLIGSTTPTNGIWTQRNITFTAPASGADYITVRGVAHNQSGKLSWMHLDNFSLNIVLPVSLINFNADIDFNREVKLSWTTASEINNSGFELQKSTDGKDWGQFGFVKGQGTSNEINEYQYQDRSPFVGINYYRLKQIDFDEAFEYSKLIIINFSEERELQFYPNPVNDKFQIVGLEEGEIVIINQTGKTFLQTNFKGSELDVSDLPSGIYFIKVSSGNKVWTKRLIKE
jgi:hypothetical protein